jgi:hypothetical protein
MSLTNSQIIEKANSYSLCDDDYSFLFNGHELGPYFNMSSIAKAQRFATDAAQNMFSASSVIATPATLPLLKDIFNNSTHEFSCFFKGWDTMLELSLFNIHNYLETIAETTKLPVNIEFALNYDSFMAAHTSEIKDKIMMVKSAAADKRMTVMTIIDTDLFNEPAMVYDATRYSLMAGADGIVLGHYYGSGFIEPEQTLACIQAITDHGFDTARLKLNAFSMSLDEVTPHIGIINHARENNPLQRRLFRINCTNAFPKLFDIEMERKNSQSYNPYI